MWNGLKIRRILLTALFIVTNSFSQTEKKSAEALEVIANFADRLCQTVPLDTSSDRIQLTVTAKAELDVLLKRLVALGISGTGKYDSESTKNVLQKDLATVLNESRQCRLQIWNDLKGKFNIYPEGNQHLSTGALGPSAASTQLSSSTSETVQSALVGLWKGSYSKNNTIVGFDIQIEPWRAKNAPAQISLYPVQGGRSTLAGSLLAEVTVYEQSGAILIREISWTEARTGYTRFGSYQGFLSEDKKEFTGIVDRNAASKFSLKKVN